MKGSGPPSIRRKRRSRAHQAASIIGEKDNERRTPTRNLNGIQKPGCCLSSRFLRILILVCIGTSSVVYFAISFGVDWNQPFATPSQATPAERTPPSRNANVFTIDRSILAKLEYLHRASGDLDELDIPTWDGHWPPLVTHIPEPRLSRKKSSSSYAEIRNLCGPWSRLQHPCRFLLPYRISEQESKARLHLFQLISLAHALNRTLILPNVGKSRVGACLGLDFEAYYDVSNLEAQGVQFAKPNAFKSWTDSRHSANSAVLIILAEKPFDHHRSEREFGIRAIDNDTIPGCIKFRFPNLNFISHPTISVEVSARKTANMELAHRLVEAVQNATKIPLWHNPDTPIREDLDVMAVNWDLRHPIFPPPSVDLQYSPRFTELSRKLSPTDPYLAVHWRTESVVPENLPLCAYALVDSVRKILDDPALAEGIRTIWLASDMPFEPTQMPLPKSGTLKVLTALHQEAIQIVRLAFQTGGELAQWRLQTLEQTLNISELRNEYDTEWLKDPGVHGILDKIIAMEATLFVGGTKRCSRVSSYTRQIIETREKSKNLGQRNVVDLFG